ncbi:MAG: CoA transferase, partial [Chloroflexi bacterium]|nr:CoA transferase [Chloroflexota bacterium]
GRTPFVPGRRAPRVGEHDDEVWAELEAPPSEAAPPTGGAVPRPERPLAGIRVLDLSWIIAGPLAARLLADFGADVIKIESRERPDVGRSNRLYPGLPEEIYSDPDVGGYFHDANAGKRSLTLDLGCDEGRALLARLVALSDVVICNLAGDQLERWGIGYERARELNPRVIVVNMPTMESRGPRARWRGFGDMFVSVSGLKSISGHAGEPPLGFGHNYADFASNPFHAAIAALAALDERERSGEGQFIEVSQYEATMGLMGSSLLEYAATGVVPAPRGNEDDGACPHDFYRCAGEESWIAIAVCSDEQWRALVAFAGVEALADPAYATLAGRRAHRAAIDAALEAWTAGHDRQALAEALQSDGVPAGPYQLIDEMVHRDPTLGRAYFVEVAHPVGRSFLVHGNTARLRRHPAQVTRGPGLGEHSYDVLTDVLGLSAEEFADLAARGVV